MAGGTRSMEVDHVVAGSGYQVDVNRISFLDLKIRRDIERVETSPLLNSTFQTSVPGLYCIGPAAAMSFGPLFRFVVGTRYTAHTLSAHLEAQTCRPE
jgi:hypothetical protein